VRPGFEQFRVPGLFGELGFRIAFVIIWLAPVEFIGVLGGRH